MSMRRKRVQPSRKEAPAQEPVGGTAEPPGDGGDDGGGDEYSLFAAALSRFVRPLKDDVASRTNQADGEL